MKKVNFTISIDQHRADALEKTGEHVGCSRKRLAERVVEGFADMSFKNKHSFLNKITLFRRESGK